MFLTRSWRVYIVYIMPVYKQFGRVSNGNLMSKDGEVKYEHTD